MHRIKHNIGKAEICNAYNKLNAFQIDETSTTKKVIHPNIYKCISGVCYLHELYVGESNWKDKWEWEWEKNTEWTEEQMNI